MLTVGGIVFSAIKEVVNLSIYLGTLSYWAISIQKRIIDKNIRHIIINVVGFAFLWLLTRTVKYYVFPGDSSLSNFCWYLYYLFQMGIVVSAFDISLFIGQKSDYKIEWKYRLILIPSFILVGLVLTNDYHELAFGVKPGTTHPGHGPVYFITVAWMLALALSTIFRIWNQYKETKNLGQIVYPIAVLAIGLTYLVLYAAGIHPFDKMEFTVYTILMIVCLFESLIQTCLIPSNSNFEWCLSHSTLKVQLLNNEYDTEISSEGSHKVDRKLAYELREHSPILVDNNTEIFFSPMRGGYTVWERDITDEQDLLRELGQISEEIETASEVLRANIRIEGKKHELAERNRLYDLIVAGTEYKVSELEHLVNSLSDIEDETFRQRINDINIRAVYIKRKSNMILVEEMKSVDLGKELKLCFKESFDNLKNAGIEADFLFREIPVIRIDRALLLYDLLESFIENGLHDICELTCIVTDSHTVTSITLNGKRKSGDVDENSLILSFAKWQELINENYGGMLLTETDGENYSVMATIPKGGQLL
ncbi:MAG: hypothetical protein MJ107_00220 [Lachnospiraceae bacterium]|nr:hypothetical protein [Lachnospiraceae bacterium]